MSRPVMSRSECGERIHADSKRLYRIAYCYVKNEQDALDIVGEAVYKALRSLDSLREVSAFSAWMTRLVVNAAIDHTRRSRCSPADQEIMENLPDRGEFDGLDEKLDLYSALDLLPADEKAYIILKYFEDMTFAQMARELGVPESTVKKRLYRALARLRRHYGMEE